MTETIQHSCRWLMIWEFALQAYITLREVVGY